MARKNSIYCIDGFNFIRSFMPGAGKTEAHDIAEFLLWLDNICALDYFKESEFRIFFDGSAAIPVRPDADNAHIIFSDDRKADDAITEQAHYLKGAGKRPVVVSDDGGLISPLREAEIKTMSCEKFYSFCRNAAYR